MRVAFSQTGAYLKSKFLLGASGVVGADNDIDIDVDSRLLELSSELDLSLETFGGSRLKS